MATTINAAEVEQTINHPLLAQAIVTLSKAGSLNRTILCDGARAHSVL
jgi:hypothetical protein